MTKVMAILGGLALAGCLQSVETDPVERGHTPLDEACTGENCAQSAFQALLSMASPDLDARGEAPSGRGTRMRWGYQVVKSSGEPVSGSLALLRQCGVSPDQCWVNLFSRTELESVRSTDVLNALYGDWRRFWRNSDLEDLRWEPSLDTAATPYQPISFTFHPLASLRSQVAVRITIHEPEQNQADPLPWLDDPSRPAVDRWDWSVPITLAGDFSGQMHLLVSERDGRVSLRETWNGVQITGALARAPAVAAILHLWATTSRTPHLLVGGDVYGLDGATGWVGLMDALEANVRPVESQEPYPPRIHETVGDEHQVRWRKVNDPLDTESWGWHWHIDGSSTVDLIDAAPEDVVGAIEGDWGCWWRRGRVTGRVEERSPTGEHVATGYHLEPLLVGDTSLVSMDVRMERAAELGPEDKAALGWTQGRAWRIRFQFHGPSFRGPAHFDVLERSDGRTALIGRFDGVRLTGVKSVAYGVVWEAARAHVRAQEGTMPLALAGSGLVGLLNLMERGEAANGDPSCR